MKAKEAPEKIYLDSYGSGFSHGFHTNKLYDSDVEYIRKDAFIEKACDFLKSYRQDTLDGMGYIAGVVNDKTIEDFKNYMKGE